jgi:predicted histone-like DNA-binding protein
MPVSYKLETRKMTTLKGEVKNITYARAHYNHSTPIEFFTKMISHISAVSAGDVQSVLNTLTLLVGDQLAMGPIVELGDLGRLRPTLRSRSVEKSADFSSSNIRRVGVIFVPGKAIKEALLGATVTRVVEEKKPEITSPSSTNEGNGNSSQGMGGSQGGEGLLDG